MSYRTNPVRQKIDSFQLRMEQPAEPREPQAPTAAERWLGAPALQPRPVTHWSPDVRLATPDAPRPCGIGAAERERAHHLRLTLGDAGFAGLLGGLLRGCTADGWASSQLPGVSGEPRGAFTLRSVSMRGQDVFEAVYRGQQVVGIAVVSGHLGLQDVAFDLIERLLMLGDEQGLRLLGTQLSLTTPSARDALNCARWHADGATQRRCGAYSVLAKGSGLVWSNGHRSTGLFFGRLRDGQLVAGRPEFWTSSDPRVARVVSGRCSGRR